MNLIVQPADVRTYLDLNSDPSASKYDDPALTNNITGAQATIEQACHRFFYDHPGVTWSETTMLRAQVAIPGFRTITACTWGGATLQVETAANRGSISPSAWAIPESAAGVDTPLYVALQFRAWRADNDAPWWLADPGWFDKALDSPFYPGNRGGGYAWTSMPNDLVITGDGGYAGGTEPRALWVAVRALAGWLTLRPAGLMGNIAVTPGGGAVDYSSYPPEVVGFIADYKAGEQAVSV